MQIHHPSESREYFDSRVDEREDSAVRVIHGAWVEHTAPQGRLEHLEPMSPLDLLVLYQAAAATFRDWTPGRSHPEALARSGRVINWEQARQRLLSIGDDELAALTMRFANQVITLSEQAAAGQDLHYYVELFLRAVQDPRVIEGILSGSISRRAQQLADPDYW
jgi:hypothetical protein